MRDGLEDYNNGDASALTGRIYVTSDITWRDTPAAVPTKPLTMAFTADGRMLTVDTGVNVFWLAITVHDGALIVDGPVTVTDVDCPKSVRAAEQWMVDFLTAAPQIAIIGANAVLESELGSITLRRRIYGDSETPRARGTPRALPDFRDPLAVQNAPLRPANEDRNPGPW